MSSLPGLVIRELAPDLVEDYLAFFDHDAFADFSWWSGCFCVFFNDPGNPEGDSSPETIPAHRAMARELVLMGQTQGLLAYVDEKPVAWCNAAPRSSYRNLRRYAVAVEDPSEPVGSLMCFVVAAPFRGKGIATALLHAACEKFVRQGLLVAEGYPTITPPTGPWAAETPWTSHNYHGPLEMFLKAGFSVHREVGTFAIVRKTLVEAS